MDMKADWSDGSFMNQRMLKMASKIPEVVEERPGAGCPSLSSSYPQKDSTFPNTFHLRPLSSRTVMQ